MKNLKMCLWLFLLLAGQIVTGQQLSAEQRAQFVAEQNAYLKELNLSFNQKRSYEEITRRYDKIEMNIRQRNTSVSKKIKKMQKLKNKEMKSILSSGQYKLYLRRQDEINEFLYGQ